MKTPSLPPPVVQTITTFCVVFSAAGGPADYTSTDLCFRDDPKIDVCIRKRINDVIEQYHKGNVRLRRRRCAHVLTVRIAFGGRKKIKSKINEYEDNYRRARRRQ